MNACNERMGDIDVLVEHDCRLLLLVGEIGALSDVSLTKMKEMFDTMLP